jgi:hypothetical protein
MIFTLAILQNLSRSTTNPKHTTTCRKQNSSYLVHRSEFEIPRQEHSQISMWLCEISLKPNGMIVLSPSQPLLPDEHLSPQKSLTPLGSLSYAICLVRFLTNRESQNRLCRGTITWDHTRPTRAKNNQSVTLSEDTREPISYLSFTFI